LIDYRQNEITIVEGLQSELSTDLRPCTVVFANQTAPAPKYPYVSYSVPTPLESNEKGYCIAKDGTRYKELTQIWSFTIHSDDDVEALNLAVQAYEYFNVVGKEYLNDNKIVVAKVGNITNRDNLLSIEYEHCNGFDVTFNLMFIINSEKLYSDGVIKTVTV
jgi:hypothetical protein